MTPAILTRGLTKRYGERAAVDGLDLRIEAGELYGLVGPNGAGKTTTIRMLLGLIHPSAGSVELLGRPVGPPVLERVGALVEEPGLWPHLSGRMNLAYLARAGGRRLDTDRRLRRIDEVLSIVGLSEAAGKKVRSYSQGMRQRLGIAMALLGEPSLLLLDEPTNALDPRGAREVRELLLRLRDAGATVVVSSHLPPEVEAICDRVGVMAQGRLVAEGPPSGLGRAIVRVEVDDRVRAVATLARIAGVVVEGAEARAGPACLRVRMGDATTIAEINRELVLAGVQVRAIGPESIEDVLLALVEGSDVPR